MSVNKERAAIDARSQEDGNGGNMRDTEERRLHQSVSMLGLRAQATAIGLVQLTAELVRAGVLDPEAVGRIKEAIAKELMLSPPASVPRAEFESWVRGRLDTLFACEGPICSEPPPPAQLQGYA
jgi:hypothetical protein